jgi:predicted transcriptional regulator
MRQFGELEAVVMDNLPRKGFPGFVIREKDGRAYRYRPVHTVRSTPPL